MDESVHNEVQEDTHTVYMYSIHVQYTCTQHEVRFFKLGIFCIQLLKVFGG